MAIVSTILFGVAVWMLVGLFVFMLDDLGFTIPKLIFTVLAAPILLILNILVRYK